MRTDAKKNLKKVATEVLKDPLASQREIASEAGMGLGTVNRSMKELEQNGTIDRTSTVIAIEESDLEIVTLAQSINLERMRDEEERAKIKAIELAHIAKISAERYSKFAGANTDKEGGEKKIDIHVLNQETADALDPSTLLSDE